MKLIKKGIFLSLSLIFLININGAQANNFIEKNIEGRKIKVIKYDLTNDLYDIKFGIADEASSVKDIMLKYNAISGMNGIFFCPKDYSVCGGRDSTINERYIEGGSLETYESTGDRVVYAWDKNKVPFLYQTNKINIDRKGDIYEGMANFPLLVQDGKNMLEYYYDVGLIDNKMLSQVLGRQFICNDKDKTFIAFGRTSPMSLDQTVDTLIKYGCFDALNLDAGYSSSLVYNGRQIVGPGRGVLDAVMITQGYFSVTKADTILNGVIDKLKSKVDTQSPDSYRYYIALYTEYNKVLKNKRAEIYNNNSIDHIDTNTGLPLGYEIEINDPKVMTRIYIINTFNSKLSSLVYELKNELKLLEKKLELEEMVEKLKKETN